MFSNIFKVFNEKEFSDVTDIVYNEKTYKVFVDIKNNGKLIVTDENFKIVKDKEILSSVSDIFSAQNIKS